MSSAPDAALIFAHAHWTRTCAGSNHIDSLRPKDACYRRGGEALHGRSPYLFLPNRRVPSACPCRGVPTAPRSALQHAGNAVGEQPVPLRHKPANGGITAPSAWDQGSVAHDIQWPQQLLHGSRRASAVDAARRRSPYRATRTGRDITSSCVIVSGMPTRASRTADRMRSRHAVPYMSCFGNASGQKGRPYAAALISAR